MGVQSTSVMHIFQFFNLPSCFSGIKRQLTVRVSLVVSGRSFRRDDDVLPRCVRPFLTRRGGKNGQTQRELFLTRRGSSLSLWLTVLSTQQGGYRILPCICPCFRCNGEGIVPSLLCTPATHSVPLSALRRWRAIKTTIRPV